MASHTRLHRARGFTAHETVSMECWCVTYDDLQNLRKSVKDGVMRGQILPTEGDPFDKDEDEFGPCVHTVVQQLIKPVTYMSGGQSWALLAHPSGIQCDLFVSHGWAEGIYEFIDKVLNSWHRGANNAYCCMLSNPQNLDR